MSASPAVVCVGSASDGVLYGGSTLTLSLAPSRLYLPGEAISGTVAFTPDATGPISELSVELNCQEATFRFQSSDSGIEYVRDCIDLFCPNNAEDASARRWVRVACPAALLASPQRGVPIVWDFVLALPESLPPTVDGVGWGHTEASVCMLVTCLCCVCPASLYTALGAGGELIEPLFGKRRSWRGKLGYELRAEAVYGAAARSLSVQGSVRVGGRSASVEPAFLSPVSLHLPARPFNTCWDCCSCLGSSGTLSMQLDLPEAVLVARSERHPQDFPPLVVYARAETRGIALQASSIVVYALLTTMVKGQRHTSRIPVATGRGPPAPAHVAAAGGAAPQAPLPVPVHFLSGDLAQLLTGSFQRSLPPTFQSALLEVQYSLQFSVAKATATGCYGPCANAGVIAVPIFLTNVRTGRRAGSRPHWRNPPPPPPPSAAIVHSSLLTTLPNTLALPPPSFPHAEPSAPRLPGICQWGGEGRPTGRQYCL